MGSKKVHIITYGCTANKNDSETMATLLEEQGHEIVGSGEADYIIGGSLLSKPPHLCGG